MSEPKHEINIVHLREYRDRKKQLILAGPLLYESLKDTSYGRLCRVIVKTLESAIDRKIMEILKMRVGETQANMVTPIIEKAFKRVLMYKLFGCATPILTKDLQALCVDGYQSKFGRVVGVPDIGNDLFNIYNTYYTDIKETSKNILQYFLSMCYHATHLHQDFQHIPQEKFEYICAFLVQYSGGDVALVKEVLWEYLPQPVQDSGLISAIHIPNIAESVTEPSFIIRAI